ncbi:MAG TPA: hypothetical protein VFB43_19915 [Terracidiphilus sp.]|nr:hypothetical protein [Terracidiphilus sp.]
MIFADHNGQKANGNGQVKLFVPLPKTGKVADLMGQDAGISFVASPWS